MKIKKIFGIVLSLFILVTLASCGASQKGPTSKVNFYFNGGKCGSAYEYVSFVYPMDNYDSVKIVDPNELDTKNPITKDPTTNQDGTKVTYKIEGWYKEPECLTKWDFDTNVINVSEEINLYAKWVKNIVFSFSVYFKDKDNNEQLLYKDTVNEGDKFGFTIHNSKTQKALNALNYTSLESYTDSEGNPISEGYTHPGGNEDTDIKIFVNAIEGEYKLVRNVNDLKAAKNSNIYLLNDIDFEGKSFSFDSYKKELQGNGYTIKNFKINYSDNRAGVDSDYTLEGSSEKDTMNLAIFTELANANIKNVTFENVTYEVKATYNGFKKIYVAPLAIQSVNSIIENVTIKDSKISVINLHKDFVLENLKYKLDNLIYLKDDNTNITNSNVLLSYEDNRNN